MLPLPNRIQILREALSGIRQNRLIRCLILLCLALAAAKALVYGTEALNLWLCRQPIQFGLSEIDSDALFLDSVLVGMAVLSLWAVLGRLLPALVLPAGILTALAFANSRKYLATWQEITLEDLKLLKEVLGILPEAIKAAPLQFAVLGVLMAGALILVIRAFRRPPFAAVPAAARITALILLAGFAASEIYQPVLFAPLARGKEVFSQRERRQNGFLLSLTKSSVPPLPKPDDYSPERAASALGISLENLPGQKRQPSAAGSEIPEEMKASAAWLDSDGLPPDVIVYLGESALDLEKRLPNVRLSKPPQPNLRAALDSPDCLHGIHVSPTFGGQTSSVEFEVLYGIPLASLPRNSFPFYTVIDRPQEALPRLFHAGGYEAIAIHNYKEKFYQRSFAYPLIGFDRFVFLKDMAARRLDGTEPPRVQSIDGHDAYMNGSDEWPSDEMLIASLMDELDRAEAEKRPVFIHAVSVTSHGGYGKWTGEERHHVQVSLKNGGKAPDELEGLASALNSADEALGALIDKIRQRRRPTILLFFGDHMPWISRESYAAGGLSEGENHRDLYDVPWFILANRPIAHRAEFGISPKISTYYLPAVLFQVLGMNGGPYFEALRNKFMKKLPVFRPDLIQDGGGQWYSGQKDGALPPEIKVLTEDLEVLAYDRLRGNCLTDILFRHSSGKY